MIPTDEGYQVEDARKLQGCVSITKASGSPGPAPQVITNKRFNRNKSFVIFQARLTCKNRLKFSCSTIGPTGLNNHLQPGTHNDYVFDVSSYVEITVHITKY